MPPVIRKPQDIEAIAVRRMWESCFPEGGPHFTDWFFTRVYRSDCTLGLFEDGELLSNLQMIPYTLKLRGRSIPMDVLSGVATGDAYRNRGYAKALMIESLSHMVQRGLGFTFLYPFNHEFYKRLGWETCSTALEYLKPAAELPDALPAGWSVREAGRQDIPLFAGVYDGFMDGRNCCSVRTKADWLKRIGENGANDGFMLLFSFGGEPASYAFVEEPEGEISIAELAYTRAEAVNAVLAALKPKGKPVLWTAPDDDLAVLLPGAWWNRAKLQPHVMFRVTDVPLAFAQASPSSSGELAIEVTGDSMRSVNNGRYLVKAASGLAQTQRTNTEPQFSCGIGTLVRILTGFMDAGEAVSAGLAQGQYEAVEILNKMYPKQRNFLFELY